MVFTRRTITRRATLAATAGALAMPRVARAQAMPELQTMRSTSRAWLWMAEDYAREGGFFEKAGVKVVSNASNRGTNVAALAGGSGVDIVLGDPGEVMSALNQDFGVRSFAKTVGRYASNVVLRKELMDTAGVTEASPVATKIALLKGLRLGTTGPGAAPDNLFRWLAVKGGMDPNRDLRLVPVQGGGPGMVAGLQQKVIDGFCLSSPTSDLAVAKAACAYLFNNATNPPPELAQYCYIIASSSPRVIRDKRDALVRYAAGLAMAMKSIREEPAKFKAFALPFLELDPSIAEAAFASNSRIYFADPVPDPALFGQNVAFLNTSLQSQGEPKLPASVTFEKMYDPSIATEAMKKLT